MLLRHLLACRPSLRTTRESFPRQIRLKRRRVFDVYSPKRPTNGEKVLGIVNLLMAEEFSPSPVGGIAEIMGQLAGGVPTAGGLR